MSKHTRTSTSAGDDSGRESARQTVDDATAEAKRRSLDQLENQKDMLRGQMNALSRALERAAETLREDDSPLAPYVGRLAGGLDRTAGQVGGRSIESLGREVGRISRENRGLFIIGSIAAGFALSRFVKSSSDRDWSGEPNDRDEFTEPASSAQTRTPQPPLATGPATGAAGAVSAGAAPVSAESRGGDARTEERTTREEDLKP